MKRLLLFLLCLCLTGCTYLGATEDILISSPDDVELSQFPTNQQDAEYETLPEASDVSTTTNSTTDQIPESTMPTIKHLILNTSSQKIHYYDNCSYAKRIDPKNKKIVDVSAEKSLLAEKYTICSWCDSKKG